MSEQEYYQQMMTRMPNITSQMGGLDIEQICQNIDLAGESNFIIP